MRRLLALARQNGASLFMVLQAGLVALLSRLGAGNDIPIGSPVAGRGDHALDGLVGFFVNTLVLRTDTSGNPGFRDLLARVRAGNLAAYSHQEVPFERLVEVLNPARSLSHHPLFQVMLAFQNDAQVSLDLPGLRSSFEAVPVASAKFDLSFALAEERAADGAPAGIAGVLEYAADLFDEATRTGDRRAPRPAAHRRRQRSRPRHRRTRHSLRRRAPHHPDRLERHRPPDAHRHHPGAVRPAGRPHPGRGRAGLRGCNLSYRELDARANQLAHHLRALGAGPETIVALCVERSFDMVIALIAILKAGAAYLPLDPDYPTERLAFMLADARPQVLLTQTQLLSSPTGTCAHGLSRSRLD